MLLFVPFQRDEEINLQRSCFEDSFTRLLRDYMCSDKEIVTSPFEPYNSIFSEETYK